ncbi:HAD family hydrolase [Plantactinospora soyae]|uniref:Hydrolase of the HAD superfamily n=1 Tax=Plantactinospora soyae TaxID=1544732 RepID=A0A927M4Y8_9ACTN|nr:HAD-IA family hydrolase [Plantactinospora soyae]MBE1487804.1 putative hydrolase of the HAD superfamily [Plantactinospora soyae]
MARERPTALLVDLDGVLRRWDPDNATRVESRYDLPSGVLYEIAMQWALLRPAVTGQLSHADWMVAVVDALAGPGRDRDRMRAAVDEWQADRGTVDPDVLAFVREARAAGVRVGLATNSTDLLDTDLVTLGLTEEVDVVVSSSTLGVHKPMKEYFQQACLAVDTLPAQVLFVDDEDRAIRGARVAGLSAYRWTGPDDLRYLRAALAV